MGRLRTVGIAPAFLLTFVTSSFSENAVVYSTMFNFRPDEVIPSSILDSTYHLDLLSGAVVNLYRADTRYFIKPFLLPD